MSSVICNLGGKIYRVEPLNFINLTVYTVSHQKTSENTANMMSSSSQRDHFHNENITYMLSISGGLLLSDS